MDGTVCIEPPTDDDLMVAANMPLFPSSPSATLTVGGKALCKHHARSPNHPFWPTPTGAPSNVNALAKDALRRIFAGAAWRNVFHLHPDVCVVEIRCAEGYGARWNLDQGLSFRGFLEPPRATPNIFKNGDTPK